MRSITLAAVSALFAVSGLAAQQAQDDAQEAPPPMVAVSYFNCAPDQVDPIIEAWSQASQQLQDQGLLAGWGVLQHAWGDEWNLMIYRVVPDLAGLQASMEAQGPVMQAVDPNLNETMAAACSGDHKDNIYWLRASNEPPADAAADGG